MKLIGLMIVVLNVPYLLL